MIRLKPKQDFSYDKVLIVSATQKEDYTDTLLYKSLEDLKYDGYVRFYNNNTKGLCELYNEHLDSDLWDCIIFAHDDVYIDSCNFVEKIYKGFEKFDVCGLAGGSRLKIKKPLLWHLMTDRSTWSGVVSHANGDSFMPTIFGEIGKRVILLDGLFLAVQPKKLKEKSVRFDENIKGFHHYDLKFSVDCFQAGLTLGTVPVHVVHSSPGLSEYTDDFKESEQYFYESLKTVYDKR